MLLDSICNLAPVLKAE